MSELTIEQKISSLEIAIGILSRDTERRLRAFEGKQETPVEDEKRKWDGLWVKIGGSEESPVLRSASLTDVADEATKIGLVVSRQNRFYGDGIHEYTKPAPAVAPEISEQHEPWRPGKCPACGYPSKRQEMAEAFLHAARGYSDDPNSEREYDQVQYDYSDLSKSSHVGDGIPREQFRRMAAVLERAAKAEAATMEEQDAH